MFKKVVFGFIAILFVSSLFNGGLTRLFDWSSAEAAGGAILEIILLIGTIVFIKEEIIPSRKKKS